MWLETASEYPNTEFEIITSGVDERLQWRIGEYIKGKFEYSYTDFEAMRKFWLEIWVNSNWDIQLSGKKEWLMFRISDYKLPWNEHKTTISKWDIFRILKNINWVMIIEVNQSSGESFPIKISKKIVQ